MPEYDPDALKVLRGLEAVRHRPLLWVSDVTATGLHRLAGQIVKAAIDPTHFNECTAVDLSVGRDGALTLTDNGRGLPVDRNNRWSDLSALESEFTELFAGGRSPEDFRMYGYLDGWGSTVNALSEALQVTTHREGCRWQCKFSRGETVEALHNQGPSSERGTILYIRPDPTIWSEPRFSVARLSTIAETVSARYPGTEITIFDEQTGNRFRFQG